MEELNTIGTMEAFTHSLRSVMALFFFYWSYRLYPYRRQWMVRLLFYATFYIACCYVKDGLLMVEGWKNDPFLINLINVIDLPFVPLTCAFFVEVCVPRFAHPWGVAGLFALQALFIPAYFIYPEEIVCLVAYVVAFAVAWMTLLFTIGYWYWYRRYEEYAYVKYFPMKWVCYVCLLFFVTLLTYYGCFEESTWRGELLFNSLSLLMWSYPYWYASRIAQAMADSGLKYEEPLAQSVEEAVPVAEAVQEEMAQEEMAEEENPPIPEELAHRIATLLLRSMEEDRLFLNPKLTIMDVAKHIEVNKTYISYYLNRCEGINFYDYVNRFRIEEACVLMGEMTVKNRKLLVDVAELSGFKSFSTFYRSFAKFKGVTPGEYARQHIKEE